MSQPTVIDVAPHTVTSETREEVAAMAAMGLSPQEIAFVLRVSPVQLKADYPDELAAGNAMATAKVGGALYKRAVNGDTKAAIFWLQARAGWRTGSQQGDAPKEGFARADVLSRIFDLLTPEQRASLVRQDAPPALPMPPSSSQH